MSIPYRCVEVNKLAREDAQVLEFAGIDAEYADQPGYHGVERFNDHDKMVELIAAAEKEGLSVHVHSEGDGATQFMLSCLEDAEKITGDKDQRNVGEAVTREQSLRAMTINIAYAWHQEDRMGSIEVGKIANMTVFDCDFLHDEAEKVANAKVVATIVDGEEVYKA